jgi:4-oxalomesaconate tautomerase
MRGGTSKGALFLADDLPDDPALRERVLASVMGGPDALQIDGLGGGHPLSSKVAIVSPSAEADCDVDYLFVQVTPGTGRSDTTQNCGNMLAAVGPFAIEQGLVPAHDPQTRVRVRMCNSNSRCDLLVPTPNAQVRYEGDTAIDGVPGTGAAILCEYLDIAGSATGAMLPSGQIIDQLNGLDVTLIDNGMPVVIVAAEQLGVRGDESPSELEGNAALVAAKEALRLAAGRLMGLGEVADKTVPKVCLVSAPANGGSIATRTFIPQAVHKSIGVLGAASVATACLLQGSVAQRVAHTVASAPGQAATVIVEHPSGTLSLQITSQRLNGYTQIGHVGVVRTARMLSRGVAFIPAAVWAGKQDAARIADATEAPIA